MINIHIALPFILYRNFITNKGLTSYGTSVLTSSHTFGQRTSGYAFYPLRYIGIIYPTKSVPKPDIFAVPLHVLTGKQLTTSSHVPDSTRQEITVCL